MLLIASVWVVTSGCHPYGLIRGPESCSYAKDDELDTSMRGGFHDAVRASAQQVGLFETPNEVVFKVRLVLRGSVEQRIPIRTPINLVLRDGRRFAAMSSEEAVPAVSTLGTATFVGSRTTWTVVAALDQVQLRSLTLTAIDRVWIRFGGVELQVKVGTDAGAAIQSLATCFQDYGRPK